MNTIPPLPKHFAISLATLFLAGSAFATNIVVTDPTRVTGSNAISPTDSALETSFNATNSTAVGTITALDTFGAVQSFAGFTGNVSTDNRYIFTFSDELLPAVQFTYTGSVPASESVALANNAFSTSTNSAMRLNTLSVSGAFTMRIDFGSYDSVSDSFTAGAEVSAAAFTLAGRFKNTTSGVTIQYLDADNNVLSAQLLNDQGHADATVAGYTGFANGSNGISAIQIAYTGDGGAQFPLFGLDDFGFTAIPEPRSYAFIFGSVILVGLCLRRRRS